MGYWWNFIELWFVQHAEAGGSAHSTEEIEDEEAFDQESDSQYEEGSEDFDEDSHEEDEDAGEDIDISRFVSGIEDRETNDEDKLKWAHSPQNILSIQPHNI